MVSWKHPEKSPILNYGNLSELAPDLVSDWPGLHHKWVETILPSHEISKSKSGVNWYLARRRNLNRPIETTQIAWAPNESQILQ